MFLLTAPCDSVTRPALRNCKQFNGHHGCDWCLHPGDVVEKGGGTMQCYPYVMLIQSPQLTPKSNRKMLPEQGLSQ